ncbi:MAG: hypothetical protein M0Z40_12145, partial [Actinomycetota bacterium]|nr:hypothetical protein [Actinomycetota bacterium]
MISTSHALRRMWDAIVGATAALLVFAAVPGVLVALVGLPAPRHWTVQSLMSWHGLFDLLAVVSWCAWAACAWPILRSVAVRVRSGDPGTAARLSDRIAVRIALGVLAITSFTGLGASVASASVASASVASAPVASAPVASASVTETARALSTRTAAPPPQVPWQPVHT